MAIGDYIHSYHAVGNVDDISNVITNISPSETPILSSAGRGKAIGVMHSWLEDDLRKPMLNAQPEGGALVATPAPTRKLMFNVTQIMEAGYAVTGTQEVVAKHGVKSELGYQMQKAAKELALDHEYALINNGDLVADTTIATGGGQNPPGVAGVLGTGVRKFRGLAHFLTSNIVNETGAVLTEDNLNTAIQDAWEAGGNPKRAYMSANNKRAASKFADTGNRSVNFDHKESKLHVAIRYYESDFGVIEMFPHRLFNDNLVLVVDPTYIKLADLRPVHRETIAKTTDSINGVLLGETTLEVRAESAHAKILIAGGTGGFQPVTDVWPDDAPAQKRP
jgi:hypothetical protein